MSFFFFFEDHRLELQLSLLSLLSLLTHASASISARCVLLSLFQTVMLFLLRRKEERGIREHELEREKKNFLSRE